MGHVLKIRDSISDLPLLRNNLVSLLNTLASIYIVLTSFLTQAIYRISYLLQFFFRLLIHVGCTGILEVLIYFSQYFYYMNFFYIFLLCKYIFFDVSETVFHLHYLKDIFSVFLMKISISGSKCKECVAYSS